MNQCPPGPQVFHWSHFELFRTFADIFANYCLSPVSTTPVINCSAVSTPPAKNLLPVSLTPAMVLMGYSGARGTLIYEKNLKSKISCQTPFNVPRRSGGGGIIEIKLNRRNWKSWQYGEEWGWGVGGGRDLGVPGLLSHFPPKVGARQNDFWTKDAGHCGKKF